MLPSKVEIALEIFSTLSWVDLLKEAIFKYEGHMINFQTFFVQVFKSVIDIQYVIAIHLMR